MLLYRVVHRVTATVPSESWGMNVADRCTVVFAVVAAVVVASAAALAAVDVQQRIAQRAVAAEAKSKLTTGHMKLVAEE